MVVTRPTITVVVVVWLCRRRRHCWRQTRQRRVKQQSMHSTRSLATSTRSIRTLSITWTRRRSKLNRNTFAWLARTQSNSSSWDRPPGTKTTRFPSFHVFLSFWYYVPCVFSCVASSESGLLYTFDIVLLLGDYSLPTLMALPSVLWRCWLGGRKGIRPVKNWAVGCWHGYLSGARCRLAYGPADATATHCLLLQ